MTTLVFGKSGQVARKLQELAPVLALGRDAVDLSAPEACRAAIERHAPSAVINAAAYTAVDKAEDEEELATVINGASPGAMACACAERDIPFVHISTDYVFDGSGDVPRRPEDTPAPISAYGRSKLAGEIAVREAGGRYAIVRTSWVFSRHRQNFMRTMLRLGAEREQLSVVADQVGGPTPAGSLAAACLSIAEKLPNYPTKSGIYHFAGAPDVSWADFAREIFAIAGLDCTVVDIASSEYPSAAKRPLNSRLDCSAMEATFGIARPDWKAELRAIMQHERERMPTK